MDAVNKEFIIRRAEDAQVKQPSPEIAKVRCISIERHLTGLGIGMEAYSIVYELAVKIYNSTELKGPFGVDHIIQGAYKYLESTKVKETNSYVRPNKELNFCEACGGTGLEFLGKNIKYEIVGDKKKPVKCKECDENKN